MQLSSYTLLIVESRVTARTIGKFEIPGLEVLSTSGYAWFPVLNPQTDRLNARANPDQRTFRNILRKKAQFANRIIVATDSDPSGEFIAQSVYRFLKKDKRILSGNLGTLNPSGIRFLLDCAAPLSQDNSSALERYFRSRSIFSNAVCKAFKNRHSLEEIVALGCLITQKEFTDFTDKKKSRHLKSLYPEVCAADDRIKIESSPSEELVQDDVVYPAVNRPVSTAFIFEGPSGSYAESQESLNRLFAFYEPEIGSGLISYPRTVATGYYEGTWNDLSSQLQQRAGAERILSPTLRRVHSPYDGHEALNVINTGLEPHELRPYLKRELLNIYRALYRHTVAALKYPAGIHAEQTVASKEGSVFYSRDGSEYSELSVIFPITTTQHLMQLMLDTGWIKASKIGNTMDQLNRSDLFKVMRLPVGHITINNRTDANKTAAFALKLKSAIEDLNETIHADEATFEAVLKAIEQDLMTPSGL